MSARIEIVGWKAIPSTLDVTAQSAQRYATEGDDLLPCLRRKRSVCIRVAELEAWIARYRASLRSSTTPATEVIHVDARPALLLRAIARAAVRVFSKIAAGSRSRSGGAA